MGTSEEFEVGAVRPEELDTMLAIMCEGFGLPFDAARDIFYSDPYFEIENKRLLRLGGRIVSCLTIVDTTCWIGEGEVRLAGIAGVATPPELRRRGYAGRLLMETLHTLDTRGFALSALFPFSYAYYRKFGWELAGFACRCLTASAYLPAYPEAQHVRLARPDDVPQLERLYNATSRGQALHCLRDAKRWLYLLDHVKQPLVYSPDKQTVEGYLLHEYRSSTTAAPEVVTPLSARVLEMRAAHPTARRGLVGYLAAHIQAGCIEYASTWDDLAQCGLLHGVTPAVGRGEPAASVEVVPAQMVRVIDQARMMEALCPNWIGFAGKLALALRDPLSRPSVQTVVVTGNGQDRPHVSVMDAKESAPPPDRIEGEVGVWSQIVVGHISADDALALGLLRASSPHAAELAIPLFPRRTPFLPVPDHF
jgi:predicted acetyltransferase